MRNPTLITRPRLQIGTNLSRTLVLWYELLQLILLYFMPLSLSTCQPNQSSPLLSVLALYHLYLFSCYILLHLFISDPINISLPYSISPYSFLLFTQNTPQIILANSEYKPIFDCSQLNHVSSLVSTLHLKHLLIWLLVMSSYVSHTYSPHKITPKPYDFLFSLSHTQASSNQLILNRPRDSLHKTVILVSYNIAFTFHSTCQLITSSSYHSYILSTKYWCSKAISSQLDFLSYIYLTIEPNSCVRES